MCHKWSLLWPKFLSQMLHLKSLTFPWTILMFPKIVLLSKLFSANAALEILNFFMNNFYVSQKITPLSKIFITNAAFKFLDFLVNNLYMPLEMLFKAVLFSTNAALVIFNFFMNNFYVWQKISLLSKIFIVNAALKIFSFLWIIFICCKSTFTCPNFSAQMLLL